ncbi:effector-associated constant component EACC1 [Streptomyces anulatus]|uniref:effector-associated constant component EACC1 n=1 Tax=Streptomyces anulatus TaxID=1892 RepID=UPI003B79A1A2
MRALSVSAVSMPGPTVGALDALEIVLGSAGDIANIAVEYACWRLARAGGRVRGARTLTLGRSKVDVSGLDPEQLADLLRRLEPGTRTTVPG